MRRPEFALLCCWLCAAVLLVPPTWTLASDDNESRYGQNCSFLETDNKCGPNERCVAESTGTGTKCDCLQGYQYFRGACSPSTRTKSPTMSTGTVKPDAESSSSGGSPLAAILLIPACLALVAALAYLGARRYKWIQRFRQFRQNRYGSVLVTRDDTDEDEPPLA